jgi:hypothetical protein
VQQQPHPNNPYSYPPPQPPPPPPYQQPQPPSLALPTPIVDMRARNAAIGLAVAGAMLLVALVSHGWFTARGGGVGLLGIEECHRSICRGMNWFDIKRAPTELKLFSTIGIIGIVASLAMLAQAAVMLFKRQAHKVALVPLNASLGIAAFGCFSFFFHLAFGEMSRKLTVSYAGLLAMAAIIGASVIIGTMVRPLMRSGSST